MGITTGDAADAIAPLVEVLGHRGPDGRGLWHDRHHTFGHTRLAIIDLNGGAQPMSGVRERMHITYNGEIYNYRHLRAAMDDASLRTQSDTEAILGLAQSGEPPERWVPKLDGMFAFALADGADLMLARDPLGIKPLYVGEIRGATAFASEIKALSGRAENITEFPPGHVFHTRTGLKRYYHLQPTRTDVGAAGEARDGVRARLEDAVRKRLIADVPVGVFLSGGLDSSVIAALARRHKHPLDTFAVGTEDSEDGPPARQVSEFLGARHHERRFDIREAIAALPEIIYYLESFDCALVRSAIPNFFLCKLAGEHVKVALSGEGADELFAGYEYLKGLDTEALDAELLDITRALHNTNLQRCDRMSMAHGLEVRVPFLDVRMVDYAFRIRLALKQHGPERSEKWILRLMAADLLPPNIAWRTKSKFAAGSGLGEKLAEFAERQIGDGEYERQREIADGVFVRSKEELFYYRAFKQMYPQDELLPLVGRSRSV
ncbi:MAG: asparagine synthase B [Planctomycetes bacterium]|nr:asparagine synthase B [Planctomycetota bacterium]